MTLEEAKNEIIRRVTGEFPQYGCSIVEDPEDDGILRVKVADVEDIDFNLVRKTIRQAIGGVGEKDVEFVPSVTMRDGGLEAKYRELEHYVMQRCAEGGTVCGGTCDDERCPIRKLKLNRI